MAVSAKDRRLTRERAQGRCEYCRMEESWESFYPYHIEHVMARQHGGR